MVLTLSNEIRFAGISFEKAAARGSAHRRRKLQIVRPDRKRQGSLPPLLLLSPKHLQMLWGPRKLRLARLRAEKSFSRCACPREKWISFYLRLRAQTLRGIFHRLKPSEKSEGFCVPARGRRGAGPCKGNRPLSFRTSYQTGENSFPGSIRFLTGVRTGSE